MHLVIYYDKLTRFDVANDDVPFSGAPGDLWKHRTLDKYPDLTYEVRILGTPACLKPLPKDCKVLGLGADSFAYLTGEPSYTFNKHRGYCLSYQGRPLIVTYNPLECWEFKDSADDADDEKDDARQEKDIGHTKRSNYLFWSLADFHKLFRTWSAPLTYTSYIYPEVSRVLAVLKTTPNQALVVVDIETRRQDNSLDCIGICDTTRRISIVVPFYDWKDERAYNEIDTARIWRAVFDLFMRKDITIVCHKADFDLAVLSAQYCLPVPCNIYDTLLAMHRQFPTVEKSLSHAISYYTYSTRNHKGDIAVNVGRDNFDRLLQYNAEDLRWTAEVMHAQLAQQTDAGLIHAVELANKLQRVMLIVSLTGINVDEEKLDAAKLSLAEKLYQLLRIIRLLSNVPTFNPASAQQCAAYFVGKLHYEVKSITKSGAPSADVNALYKWQVAQPNPLIPLIIKYRETAKQHSMMKAKLYEPIKL